MFEGAGKNIIIVGPPPILFMNHQESSIKVYYTKDYSLFTRILGNRQINKGKIRRIRNDILHGLDVLRYCPILVRQDGNKLEIIDGQHRFEVAKEMHSQVWYILVEDMSLHDIAKINSNTEKWTTQDYIHCYARQGNLNYITLQEFLKESKYPLSITLRLLSTGTVGGDSGVSGKASELFKRGEFQVKFLSEAQRLFEATKLFSDFEGWNNRHFILAIDIILRAKKCDFVELVSMYNEHNIKLERRNSVKEYLTNLEEIYNYRMRSRRVIYS